MTLDLITSSAADYVGSVGKPMSDYEMRGFSASGTLLSRAEELLIGSAERLGCEAVVDVRYSIEGSSNVICAGTGLIPRIVNPDDVE